MKIVCIITSVLIIFFCLYLLSLRGRTGNKLTDKFLLNRYAHRGLFKRGVIPENSLAAFSAAVNMGFGIELDVHLLKDGSLAVIHDYSLDRTTGRKGNIEDLYSCELNNIYLENSKETIPSFKDVLKTVSGRVPLIIELKSKNNVSSLCKAVVNELKGYKGKWCIESFDPRCVYWFKKYKPDTVRGQLVMNYVKGEGKVKGIMKYLLSWQFFNFLTKPDFISVKFKERMNLSNIICKKLWKMKFFCWTITDFKELYICEREGFTPIFEQIEPNENIRRNEK